MAHSGHAHAHGRPGPAGPGCGRSARLPVVVLTGYLGAGKTTLLNYILKEQHDKKLAVIENEIGEVSIDDDLVEQKQQDMAEELVVLDNGCVCCTIRGDLVKSLEGLAVKWNKGLALDGVLIELTGMADPAPVVQTFFLYQEVAKHFYIDNVVALVDAKHAIEKIEESQKDPDGKGTAASQIAFSSTVLLNKTDLVGDAELGEVEKRIKQVNSTVEVIRCEQARAPLNKLFGVGVFQLEKVLEEQYMDEEEFTAFYKPKMDYSVSNVGVRCTGAIVMFAFQQFLDQYLGEEESAKDFLRVKGVLDIAGGDKKFVLQCVHMLKKQAFTEPWGGKAKRENRIIFIGRGMQQRREELTEGFKNCLAKPLRFAVGTMVKAKTGPGDNDYELGIIRGHWHQMCPYRIELKSSKCDVTAPMDDDNFVKAA